MFVAELQCGLKSLSQNYGVGCSVCRRTTVWVVVFVAELPCGLKCLRRTTVWVEVFVAELRCGLYCLSQNYGVG